MRLVDKAMQAETNGLWGRAYFDLRGLTNGAYKLGDDWLRGAADAARRSGFETVVDDRPETFSAGFPMSQIALYAGWYDGAVSGPFARPDVEFMPGAFAYHLHSFSAHTLRSATQNWCGPLLAAGVTATMGCIDEPYLSGTPDMRVFFSRWLSGFTFGEAACAAQHAVSWQTTVVGDPLYRPFGADLRALRDQLAARHSPSVEWSDLRLVNFNLAAGQAPDISIGFLESDPNTPQSAILSEKLASLYQTAGRREPAINALRQALALHPTPQTIVRLTLALGDLLAAAGRESDALKLYDDFQKNSPAYPDALALWQKMQALAVKTGNPSQAARCSEQIRKLSPKPGP
jgi:tetratricopeptide (TPR) repeat protein